MYIHAENYLLVSLASQPLTLLSTIVILQNYTSGHIVIFRCVVIARIDIGYRFMTIIYPFLRLPWNKDLILYIILINWYRLSISWYLYYVVYSSRNAEVIIIKSNKTILDTEREREIAFTPKFWCKNDQVYTMREKHVHLLFWNLRTQSTKLKDSI